MTLSTQNSLLIQFGEVTKVYLLSATNARNLNTFSINS